MKRSVGQRDRFMCKCKDCGIHSSWTLVNFQDAVDEATEEHARAAVKRPSAAQTQHLDQQ